MGLGDLCQSIGPATLASLAALVAAGWLGAGVQLALARRHLPSLADAEPATDTALPSLTVVAAARDEAARVEHAVRSLLSQDYPDLRVVVADDRSVDGTGTILDRVAAVNPRLRVIHIETLPEGWIGKSHALAVAAAQVQSDWLLFTDGDVTFAPDAARRAISLAIAEGADHVAVAPHLIVEGIGEAAFTGYFVVMFHLSQRPWRARDPRSGAAVGIGAFNLVRRAAYARSGGHEGIRHELLDDIALGRSLKRSGARTLFALDGGRVHARWQVGTAGLIRGVEKNAFAAFGFRTLPALLGGASQFFLAITPVAGFFFPGWLPKVAALVAWVGAALAFHATYWGGRHRWLSAALMPVGGVLFGYAILRSIVLALVRRGVYWRGTFYPLEKLKATPRA